MIRELSFQDNQEAWNLRGDRYPQGDTECGRNIEGKKEDIK